MTLRERIARKLHEMREVPDGWAFEAQREYWLESADAILAEMREPTEEQQAAGRDAIEPYVGKGLSRAVNDQWQIARETWIACIDAALAEKDG